MLPEPLKGQTQEPVQFEKFIFHGLGAVAKVDDDDDDVRALNICTT